MTMHPRILVIGLDAATFDLIRPWARDGHLPAIAGLMRDGASGTLLSTPNMHSASAWTSILTGLAPGRHGLFVFSDRDYATGSQKFFNGGHREGRLITSHLAEHALTSGLLNVPMTYPAECPAGSFAISGLDSPSLNDSAFCPPSFRQEVFARFPDYAFTPKSLGKLMADGDVSGAIQTWIKLIETQTRAAEHLLESHPVDFFMTVYTASDWGGHNLWKYYDPPHEDHDSTAASPLRDSLLTIYRALDAACSRLLSFAGDRTQVYIISDHGMGRHSGASYQLADWLESAGYLVRRDDRNDNRGSMIGTVSDLARRWLPQGVKDSIKSRIAPEKLRGFQSADKDAFYASIDWTTTTAYTEPGRHVININLEGRNADGNVKPSEYDELCVRIIKDLKSWKDGLGERVVERVDRREDVYQGPHAERASDMFIHWNPKARMGPPPAEIRSRGFWWSGDHRPEGILICKGPGLQRGTAIDGARVYDVVPTLMYLAGLPVPSALDGRVIGEACDAAFLEKNPIVTGTGGDRHISAQAPLNDSEEKMIEEKLRDLGYL